MILTIARKEFTEMLRDGRFRLMVFVVLALLLAALAAGWKHSRSPVTTRRGATSRPR